MLREDRLQLLLEIVSATPVRRQDELVRLLQKKGFAVTQASVSRDLEELGVTKRRGVYRPQIHANRSTFGMLSFHPSGENLIVAKCGSGLARSEEHTSELQSQSISYAVFCLKKKKDQNTRPA